MKFLFGLLFVFAFYSITFSQNITVTPQKKIYTRKAKDVPSERKIFTVVYPIVKSADATIKTKIENAISYWNVFDISLEDNLNDDFWLTDLNYKIIYNKNGILDIALMQEGVGAYPDSQTVEMVIDIKTGARVAFSDVIRSDMREELTNLVNKKLEIKKKEVIQQIDKNEFGEYEAAQRESFKQEINDLKFAVESFTEFAVSDQGITVIYDAGFPHVIQALEPEGRFFFDWAQIKSYIKPDGLLGRFTR